MAVSEKGMEKEIPERSSVKKEQLCPAAVKARVILAAARVAPPLASVEMTAIRISIPLFWTAG